MTERPREVACSDCGPPPIGATGSTWRTLLRDVGQSPSARVAHAAPRPWPTGAVISMAVLAQAPRRLEGKSGAERLPGSMVVGMRRRGSGRTCVGKHLPLPEQWRVAAPGARPRER